MSIEEDILIQKFLKNTLSEQERADILLRIENDEKFKEKVALEEQMVLNFKNTAWNFARNTDHPHVKEYENLLRDESTLALQNTLATVNNQYQQNQKKKKLSWMMYSGVAAILLIIGLTVFSSTDIPNGQLYTEYINLSELPSLVDRGNSDQKNNLIKAQQLFEAQKYDQTLAILSIDSNSIIQRNKATIYLYKGIAQMELNRFQESEETFNLLINSNLIDAPKGIWYKSLLYIKTNEIGKAKKLLHSIIESSTNYKYQEARELLNQL